jgi:hypothetical protein
MVTFLGTSAVKMRRGLLTAGVREMFMDEDNEEISYEGARLMNAIMKVSCPLC